MSGPEAGGEADPPPQDQARYIPTPEEIEAEAARIRQAWVARKPIDCGHARSCSGPSPLRGRVARMRRLGLDPQSRE